MDSAEIFVVVGGLALCAFVVWFFFGPRASEPATIAAGEVQQIRVVVKGGYLPDRIEVEQGKPVCLLFRREESTACTEQVIFGEFGISETLPQGKEVAVEFTPSKSGEFTFHCGMNMVCGKLIVKPGGVKIGFREQDLQQGENNRLPLSKR